MTGPSRRRDVKVIDNAWVVLEDGCRIAIRIWLPVDALKRPVPAILEAHPYRKSDCTAPSDESRNRYTAEHGYATVRMDLRGSGDSDGTLDDEYLPQEQLDICAVIEWLAAQPWCTGRVGMTGISWGGFNSLQVAARRPPALSAVISVCGTDDRYADDVHYMGGCVIGSEMLSWSSTMLAYNARPPDPHVVGDRWRDMWIERVQACEPPIHTWLSHQRRDYYWKQGSVCENYEAIACPVFLVGGWADGYRNSVIRMLEAWPQGITRALLGPWGHMYPHNGAPGPAVGFLQETIRWWDHWLKDLDTGLLADPPIRVWMQNAVEPSPTYATRPGRWIGLDTWKADRSIQRLHLTAAGLGHEPAGQSDFFVHAAPTTTASHPGSWCAAGREGDMASDQRGEDGQSLTFTSAPLKTPAEILGCPTTRLVISADRTQANIVVRLCDVAPNGRSTLITRTVLNLTHSTDHERPAALRAGSFQTVDCTLSAAGYVVPAGNCIRIGVSAALWPLVWPSPEPVTLTLDVAGSHLDIPLLSSDVPSPALHLTPFGPPEASPGLEVEYIGEARDEPRREMRDVATERQTLVVPRGYPVVVKFVNADTTYDDSGSDVFEITNHEPLSATARSERFVTISRDGWLTRVELQATMTADGADFILDHSLDAYDGDDRISSRTWSTRIPRDHV